MTPTPGLAHQITRLIQMAEFPAQNSPLLLVRAWASQRRMSPLRSSWTSPAKSQHLEANWISFLNSRQLQSRPTVCNLSFHQSQPSATLNSRLLHREKQISTDS